MPVASAACLGPRPSRALLELFDAREPWPIREVDHGMRGGAGIMLDDVMAALMAAALLQLIQKYT